MTPSASRLTLSTLQFYPQRSASWMVLLKARILRITSRGLVTRIMTMQDDRWRESACEMFMIVALRGGGGGGVGWEDHFYYWLMIMLYRDSIFMLLFCFRFSWPCKVIALVFHFYTLRLAKKNFALRSEPIRSKTKPNRDFTRTRFPALGGGRCQVFASRSDVWVIGLPAHASVLITQSNYFGFENRSIFVNKRLYNISVGQTGINLNHD